MILKNETGKIDLPISKCVFSEIMFDLYRDFNLQEFPREVSVPASLGQFVNEVYKKYNQEAPMLKETKLVVPEEHRELDHDKVLLGFSGGLDSTFQLCNLLNHGWKVTLFVVKNINTYENGQGVKACRDIYDMLKEQGYKIGYVEASIAKDWKKDNKWRQSWPENPIKNQLILAMMADYCLENGIGNMSLGDDFELDVEDSVCGINTTDARQFTNTFLDGVERGMRNNDLPLVFFIQVDPTKDKLTRLVTLDKCGLTDKYYSCVQAGRFNRKLHLMAQTKYGVKLPEHNCGCYCRKCAMHCLMIYYWWRGGRGDEKSLLEDKATKALYDKFASTFTEEFIERCWQVMWKNSHSADYKFFSPEIPLEKRIHNLYHY